MDAQQLTQDTLLMAKLAEMVVLAASCQYGEVAGFLVKDRSGRLGLVMWPRDCSTLQAQYRGAIPVGAVAIVHTHPELRIHPSREDVAAARRTGLATLVMTRRGITMADPSTGETGWLLENSGWTVRPAAVASK